MKIRERNNDGSLGEFKKVDPKSKTKDELIKDLDKIQKTLNDRTKGMQEIDDFTLELVYQLQAEVQQLREEINTLKGGA